MRPIAAWAAAAALIPVLLGVAGCTTNDHQQCSKQGLTQLVAATDSGKLFDDIATGFCPASCSNRAGNGATSCDEPGLSRLCLVPDFVNIINCTPGTTGLYMGEQMRAALSQRCNSQIYQAEFGHDLKLSGEGLVALTRNSGEIVRDEFIGQDIIIGTYSYSGNRLSLFVRKIAGSSGVISKMISKELVYSCGTLGTSAKIVK